MKYVETDQKDDMLDIFKELIERSLDPRAEDAKFRTAIDIAFTSINLFIVAFFGQNREGMVMDNVVCVNAESVEEESEEEMSWDEM
jgi:hypothetical protein